MTRRGTKLGFFLSFSLALAFTVAPVRSQASSSHRTLSFEERVAAQISIEQVYWGHRIWPPENRTSKPRLEEVLPESAIRARVENYLLKSNQLEKHFGKTLRPEELQAEIDRMAAESKQPEILRELFATLHDDPFLIAECLARPALAERLLRSRYTSEETAMPLETWLEERRFDSPLEPRLEPASYVLPTMTSSCTGDSWTPTLDDAPDPGPSAVGVWTGSEMIVMGRFASKWMKYRPDTETWTAVSSVDAPPFDGYGTSAVWTGTEMIVWSSDYYTFASGARYNPSTDTWTPISQLNAPSRRSSHTAVWTGSLLIIWGGNEAGTSGGRYDPVTDTWLSTSMVGAPSARFNHTAAWASGPNVMVVWGGETSESPGSAGSGGRYDPVADTWSPTTITGAPVGRQGPASVWTGSRILIWGGCYVNLQSVTICPAQGGRYDPVTDAWSPMSTSNQPTFSREDPSAVWTGTEMIVWGGAANNSPFNTGGRYRPATDSWTQTSTVGAPSARTDHLAVWTGTEMIVWGGAAQSGAAKGFATGGRYDPGTNHWTPTGVGTTPGRRVGHSAIWTGTEMIVWGGAEGPVYPPSPLATGARYTPATNTWEPTSTVGAPSPRSGHSAVWTGSEMIVWGGGTFPGAVNTGARYQPATNAWTGMTTSNAPTARSAHSAVWSGNEMIVWGGFDNMNPPTAYQTGARYAPSSDSWTSMQLSGAPGPRWGHSARWTGSEMLVRGGFYLYPNSPNPTALNDGARYRPSSDAWLPMASMQPPAPGSHVTVWTGNQMIVWAGPPGASYDPALDTWTPLSTTGAPGCSANLAFWTGEEMLVWCSGIPQGGRYAPSTDSWSSISVSGAPPAIQSTNGVWTGSSMVVWGGATNDVQSKVGGVYCACPNGAMFYRDADGDGYGSSGLTLPSCSGTPPAGYVASGGDCNDANAAIHPGAAEACNSIDDDCDGLVDEDAQGVDSDQDGIRNACDDCPLEFDASQSDTDQDGEGDVCDLDDGSIWEFRDNKTSLSWQHEQGPSRWNVYIGSLAALKSSGVYTQVPGSNPLAARDCGETVTFAGDPGVPGPGGVSFSLVTGVQGGVEGSLGSSSAGPRPNANPCP